VSGIRMTTGRTSLQWLRPRARTLGKAAVGLWTLAWLLTVLQPCCEAIAADLPHAHGPAESDISGIHAHHAEYGSGDVHAHSDSKEPHSHCASVEAPSQTAPALTATLYEAKTDTFSHALVAPSLVSIGFVPAVLPSIATVPRSPLTPPYLLTLRLRL